MSKPYMDNRECDHCKVVTPHWCVDSDHERDSSADHYRCTICGWFYAGYSGRYEEPLTPYDGTDDAYYASYLELDTTSPLDGEDDNLS